MVRRQGHHASSRLLRLLKIIWVPEAEADRDRIWFFLAERSVEWADRVEARIDDRVASLSGVPRQGRPAGRSHCDLSIPDINLVVRYRVDEDAIRILEMWDTRQNRTES